MSLSLRTTLFIFSTALFFTIACNNPGSKEGGIFLKYLEKKGYSIQDDYHVFIVLPNTSCMGCVSGYISIIESHPDIFDTNYISILTSKLNLLNTPIAQFNNFLYDEEHDLDYLDLNLYNVCVIELVEGEFDKVFHFNIDQQNLFYNQFIIK